MTSTTGGRRLRHAGRMEPLNSPATAPWNGDRDAARALQAELARQVLRRDRRRRQPRWIAGFDVGFEDAGAITRAAAVLLDARSLAVRETVLVRIPTEVPYLRGLLAFREVPALLVALAQLRRRPDLAFVDGHGIAHPRGLGVAAHFGVLADLPSIGVAKKRLTGAADPPGPRAGDHATLTLKGDAVGWVLRSRAGCRPLFVSPGHRVSLDGALAETLACLRGYRLPEPTRLADRLASRRGEVAVAPR